MEPQIITTKFYNKTYSKKINNLYNLEISMGQLHYIYPKLFAHVDLGFARIGGSGLANCLFIYYYFYSNNISDIQNYQMNPFSTLLP